MNMKPIESHCARLRESTNPGISDSADETERIHAQMLNCAWRQLLTININESIIGVITVCHRCVDSKFECIGTSRPCRIGSVTGFQVTVLPDFHSPCTSCKRPHIITECQACN